MIAVGGEAMKILHCIMVELRHLEISYCLRNLCSLLITLIYLGHHISSAVYEIKISRFAFES